MTKESKFGTSKTNEYRVTEDGKIRVYKKSTGELKKEYDGIYNRERQKTVVSWVSEEAGKEVTVDVAKLVAQAFVPNPKGLRWIMHKNKVLDDNRAENLEWSSSQDRRFDYWDKV